MSEEGNGSALPKKEANWAELLSGKNAVYSIALGGSVGLHALNIYIAATMMPSMVQNLGGLDYYAWSTTLFVAASILGSALSAILLHRAGPRGAYVAAAVVFGVGTLICACAATMPQLLIGRFVQGFGGGFLYALAYGVIRLVFPEHLWARAIGLISAVWGVATLAGPAVGGVFAELGAWRTAFWCLIPVALLLTQMAYATLPKVTAGAGTSPPVPVPQIVLLAAAVLVLSAGSISDLVLWNVVGTLGALALIALLVAFEVRSQARLLPTGALKITAPLGLLYATIAFLIVGMQPEVFVPYFFQVLLGQSPLLAGYLAALMAIGWTSGSMLSVNLRQSNVARAIVIGPSLGLFGLATLAITLPIAQSTDWVLVGAACAGLLSVGFGIGITWPHLVTQVFQAAPPNEQERAAAAITTVQLFATALGSAAAGMVANLAGIAEPGGVAGASNAAFWLLALFALAPAVAAFTAWQAVCQRGRAAEAVMLPLWDAAASK